MKHRIIKISLTILLLSISILLKAKTYAVIVGVNKYDNPQLNLNACVEDASKIYRFLNKNKENEVVFLADYRATKSNILYAMEKVYSKAKKGDMIVFYFSGHGDVGMFCPTNILSGLNPLLHTEIRAKFKKSKASYKLLIADACYAGSVVGTASGNYSTSRINTKENIVFFMSSRDDETSIESRFLNAGFFTHYFVKGMEGAADRNKDRKITLYELYAYVRKNVRRDSSYKQTPIMYGRFKKNAVIGRY